MVAFVSEQFEERHAEVGRASLDPGRVSLREQVDEHLPEARVVASHVIERRLGKLLRRAKAGRRTVEVDWAPRPEIDWADREESVDTVEVVAPSTRLVKRPADRQQVRRKVALLVDFHVEHIRISARRRAHDLDVDDPGAAMHTEWTRISRKPERRAQKIEKEMDMEDVLAGNHVELDEIDAVQQLSIQEQCSTVAVAAAGAENLEDLSRARCSQLRP